MQKEWNTYLKGTTLSYRGESCVRLRMEKGRAVTVIFTLVFIVFAVISPKTVIGATARAADSFARSALPVLLPFAVASGILIRCGVGDACGRRLGKPFERLFGISGAFAAPFLLGAVAGFPIGARSVCELYGRGECDREEAERALAFCSNPGVGFTVAGVGGALWGDLRFGFLAWFSCLAASALIAMLGRGENAVNRRENTENELGFSETEVVGRDGSFVISRVVTEAVREAAMALVSTFAFVVFFNAISAVLRGITVSLRFSESWIGAVVTAVMEFSSGVAEISEATFPQFPAFAELFADGNIVARVITVAALSWSGMSVHMQVAGFTASCGISMRKYYRGKIASALLAPLIFLIFTVVGNLVTIM